MLAQICFVAFFGSLGIYTLIYGILCIKDKIQKY